MKETHLVFNNSDDDSNTEDDEVDEEELASFNDFIEGADDTVDVLGSSMRSGVSRPRPRDMHAMSPPHRNVEVLQVSLRRVDHFFTLCPLTL